MPLFAELIHTHRPISAFGPLIILHCSVKLVHHLHSLYKANGLAQPKAAGGKSYERLGFECQILCLALSLFVSLYGCVWRHVLPFAAVFYFLVLVLAAVLSYLVTYINDSATLRRLVTARVDRMAVDVKEPEPVSDWLRPGRRNLRRKKMYEQMQKEVGELFKSTAPTSAQATKKAN